MKKMNIALFTAAAMIGSTAAIADEHVDGPNLHGRIQTVLSDADSDANEDLTMNSWHIAASGSASDLIGGIDASYYARVSNAYVEGDSDTGNTSVDRQVGIEYGFVAFDLGGAELTLGRDDDLNYYFAESMIFANQPRAYNGIGGAAFNNGDGVKLTSDLGGSPVTVGVYASDKNNTGVDEMQVGVSADIGVGTISVVYSDDDQDSGAYTERTTVAGSFDLGVATVAARVSDRESGENPYTIAVGVPVNASTTIYVIHGADDGLPENGHTEDDSSTGVELRTVLGAGLEAFAGMTTGEKADGTDADNLYVGSRWQF